MGTIKVNCIHMSNDGIRCIHKNRKKVFFNMFLKACPIIVSGRLFDTDDLCELQKSYPKPTAPPPAMPTRAAATIRIL